MPIVTDGPMLEPQNKGVDEFHVGIGASLGASVSEAVSDLPTAQLFGAAATERAKGSEIDFGQLGTGIATPGFAEEQGKAAASPRIDIIDANDRVKKAGLEKQLTLPNQPDIPPAQLEIMMSRARERHERETTMERGPQGFVPSALQVGTSFLVGAVDPINIASAFIPVVGEMRYGKMLAAAGDGLAGRLAVRGGVGAAQGAAGQAALEPLDWWSHTQDGRDFGMSDVLHNVLFGAALGGALHAGGGAVSDVVRNRQGRALYPFGPGEPLENVRGTHLPADVLHEDGITPEALEAHFRAGEGPSIEPHDPAAHEPIFPEDPDSAHVTPAALSGEVRAARPAEPSPEIRTIDDLPQRAKEDAARAGIANLIDGEPVRVGEMLEAAARSDPRIAESFDAFHGSPHDFDRFDLRKIGTGEGAQAYGHGLYFAENEAVARDYRTALSIKGYDSGRPFGSSEDNATYVAAGLIDRLGSRKAALAEAEKHALARPDPFNHLVTTILKSDAKIAPLKSGTLYKVRVKADHDHLLDWDKPISEQTQHVRAALKKVADDVVARDPTDAHDIMKAIEADERADTFYERLADALKTMKKTAPDKNGFYTFDRGHAAASRTLQEAGLPGLKYLDQGSRPTNDGNGTIQSTGNGKFNVLNEFGDVAAGPFDSKAEAELALKPTAQTRNFVVFDDKHIEITHKNGEPVNREQFLQERRAPVDSSGFPPDDLDSAQTVAPKAPRGRAAADPQTWSLYEFLAHEGGLKPDPELEAVFGTAKGPFVPSFGALVRPGGRTLDDALRLAKDHGYLFDAADVTGAEAHLTPRDLLDRLAEENSGRKQYRNEQQHATRADVAADLEREKHEIISALHDEIEATTGVKGARVDPALESRVVEIIQKEGQHDVLAAYERAIMEDAERYEGLANVRRQDQATAHLAGWDAADAGTAPRAGAADPRPRRQGRLSDQGEGGTDGRQSPGDGNGDRAPAQNALDRDAAWRALSVATPDFNEPAVIAASKAAAEVKAPPTRLDERVTAAQKADAYAKQMVDMFGDRLEPQERQRLDDLIKTIDGDNEAREIAIQRGAACLFGAR